MQGRGIAGAWAMVLMAVPLAALAAGPDMMRSRVPADKLAEARALRNPLPDSPETVEKGKALYHGKGTCVTCHGANGAGDGPASKGLNPQPRNFQHHGFWRHRTEGELYYVIKNGSPGTAMAPFGAILTDEEIWSLIRYERTFSRHRGPHKGMRGMGGRGPMGRMGPQDEPTPSLP
ncbi:MAG: hypothetical protein OJF52_003350 [Nitrospira sp.]|nr:MAG: hypothetical protein OJF52_003350 [Nitrospira sp.]